jgi:hypothetical protein
MHVNTWGAIKKNDNCIVTTNVSIKRGMIIPIRHHCQSLLNTSSTSGNSDVNPSINM